MPLITLMTDFGIKDGNVGVMKGVIWGICPEAHIADISHMIGAQNLPEAALVLARSAPYFPRGTIHVAVVDPGVGTARRPMAAQIGDWSYVGPDNGLITLLLQRGRAENWHSEFFVLDKPEFWRADVSHVFHGRDIFAPVAAHLARGTALSALGTPFADPVRLDLAKPVRRGRVWQGEVIHVDHFGNLASNIREENLGEALGQRDQIGVRLGGAQINGLVNTFGERTPGEVVALLGSTGNLIVSVVNGSAASVLGVGVGAGVEVTLPSRALGGAPAADPHG